MKAVILPVVWLSAICGAGAAPLDLQLEPGVPTITASFSLADETAAIDFFEREKPHRPEGAERESPVPFLASAGVVLAAAAVLTPLGRRLRRVREARRRRSRKGQRQMAWI